MLGRLAIVRGCALAAVLLIGTVAHSDAQPLATRQVIVRVYDGFGVSAGDLRRAQDLATAIFATGGISIQWRLCPRGHSHADMEHDPCSGSLSEREVSVRFVRSDRRDGDTGALGVSLIDTDRHVGSLASVFPDRVTALALRAHVRYATLLGRALAHEIGHLCLGTTAHSLRGVMRAYWTQDSLRIDAPTDWSFSAGDAVRLARALDAREAPKAAVMVSHLHQGDGRTAR